MLNIIILVVSVVTLALMTSDPRASEQESIQSAWQQNSKHHPVKFRIQPLNRNLNRKMILSRLKH
ncbi:ABZJ_00068 family colistin stress protein [Acinetobacter terrae]